MTEYTRSKFWGSRDQYWPREPEGSIFLARAMLQAAPVVLDTDLDGKEFTTEWVESLPLSPSFASPEQLGFAHRLLARLFPEREIPALMGLSGQNSLTNLGRGLVPPAPSLSQEDWDAVRRMVADRQAEIFPTLQQRAAVTEWFARAIFDRGEIKMYACHITGGEMLEARPAIWNVKWPGFEHVLRNCSTNWDEPMNPEAERTHYLFLHKVDFERALTAHMAGNGERSERMALLDNPEAANASAPHVNANENEGTAEPTRTPKTTAALTALSALYPTGIPAGLAATTRDDAVKAWLRDNHAGVQVSARLISAAATLHRNGERT